MTRSRTTRIAAGFLTLIAAAPLGCGMNRRYANSVIQQLPHSDVSVVYKWSDAPRPASDDAKPAGDVERTLTVVYPHPNPSYGRRYADVSIRYGLEHDDDATSNAITKLVTNPFRQQDESKGPASSDSQTMHLLLNREELEFLLRDLVADGFFEPGEREHSKDGVKMVVSLDSRSTTKRWDRITAFDNLADRVRSENLFANRPRSPHQSAQPSAALLAPTPEVDADQPESHDIDSVSRAVKF